MVKIVIKSKYVAKIITEDNAGVKFVSTGDKISKGALLFKMDYLSINIDFFAPCNCIINEIFVENESIIEYGQKIISIIQC